MGTITLPPGTLLILYHLDRDNPHTSEHLLLQGWALKGYAKHQAISSILGMWVLPHKLNVSLLRMVLNRKQSTLSLSLSFTPLPPHTHPQTWDFLKFSWMKNTGKNMKKQIFPPLITWNTHFISSQMKIITQVFRTKFKLSFMPSFNSQLSYSYFQYF